MNTPTPAASPLPATPPAVHLENGQYGRVVVARIKPNEDLVGALEQLCLAYRMPRAVVRGVLGSLIEGCLSYHGPHGLQQRKVPGPGVEILNVFGEVFAPQQQGGQVQDPDAARATQLNAVISGTDGAVYAGRLVRGANLAFITIEASLQEWIVAAV
jgi:predicted DNA-binding protein with PD1-like motif